MLGIFAKTFNTATRTDTRNHWGNRSRFDERRDASYFPHTVGERRD